MAMAPMPIAQLPRLSAPLRRATNPKIIPTAPKRIGKTNSEMIERAKAVKPIPFPLFRFYPELDFLNLDP